MIGSVATTPIEQATRQESDRLTSRTCVRLRARVTELEGALAEVHQVLEEDYGNGVDNGYFPTVGPILKRVRALLGMPENAPRAPGRI